MPYSELPNDKKVGEQSMNTLLHPRHYDEIHHQTSYFTTLIALHGSCLLCETSSSVEDRNNALGKMLALNNSRENKTGDEHLDLFPLVRIMRSILE